MRAVTALVGRRTSPVVLVATLALAALAFLLPAPTPTTPLVASGLPQRYQSTVAALRQAELPTANVSPALAVVTRRDGGRLSAADITEVETRAARLAAVAVDRRPAAVSVSPDGHAAVLLVPLATPPGQDSQVAAEVTRLRTELRTGLPDRLLAQVTGGPAYTADLTNVFSGADTRLLLVTVLVVAVLLIITYRSPWLWLVPIVVVGTADQVAGRVVALLAPHLGLVIDGAASGITSVLVFGAGTDYALLLIARYREELRGHEDRFEAMRRAVHRTAEPVLASAATVTASLLTLLFATSASTRGLGFSGAVGIITAMLAGLVVLPAAMALVGRRAFWPFVPRVGSQAREGRVWGRVGALVVRRPVLVAVAGVAVLLTLSTGAVGLRVGLSSTQQFRVAPEAVAGQQTLGRHFPAGATEPVAVLTTPAAVPAVVAAARSTPGVTSVTPGQRSGTVAEVDVVLDAPPGTEASYRAVRELRAAVGAVPGAEAVVGGTVATALDTKTADARDTRLLVPLILVIVFTALVLLLRALVAPLVLIGTVVLSYLAALGLSWQLLAHLAGFPALDTGVLLLSFLFLVALGVDYSIFLVTRAREESRGAGTAAGMVTALTVTGGVITSAGILLAAVFAVLGVLPLVALAQIGTIVCVGVLLDTLLVRTVVVPAVAVILGDRFWWPGGSGAPTAPRSAGVTATRSGTAAAGAVSDGSLSA